MEECFESGWRAFDLAERLQTPIFVLSDLDLGMNLWMSEPFTYPDKPIDRGKVLSADELAKLGGFHRYADVDGMVSALSHAARHRKPTGGVLHPWQRPQRRGAIHRARRRMAGEHGSGWRASTTTRARSCRSRFLTRTLAPRWASSPMARTTRRWPRRGACWRTGASRRTICVCAPCRTTDELRAFVAKYPRLYVVENNFDAQMAKILRPRRRNLPPS